MLAQIIHYLFWIYTLMIFARIFGSWVPQFSTHPLMQFIAYYTDPYLHFFRRLTLWALRSLTSNQLFEMIDFSPMLALFALNILEWLVTRLLF